MELYPQDPRSYLRSEYVARNRRNPAYSWRSFARDLKLSPSMLSEFLKGRYGFSRTKAQHVAEQIQLDEEHTEHFIDLLEADFHRTAGQRQMARLRADERLKTSSSHVAGETLAQMLDWTYFAILEVVGFTGGKIDPSGWIKPFQQGRKTVDEALKKLVDLKMLKTEGGHFRASEEITVANDQIPTEKLEALHAQVLDLAQIALEHLPTDQREALSVFASVAAEDLPEIKKELNDLFLEVLNKYSNRSPPDSVFCFALQAFPLYTKPR